MFWQFSDTICRRVSLQSIYTIHPFGFCLRKCWQAIVFPCAFYVFFAYSCMALLMYVGLSLRYLEMMASSAVLGMMRSCFSLTISQNFLLETHCLRVVVYSLILNINCCQLMQLAEEKQPNQIKFLIIVFGPPASGKTTFARALLECHRQQNEQKDACLMVSADCLEEYLRDHSISQLKQIACHRQAMRQLMQLKLKRSQFVEQNWKLSRHFLKQHIPAWLKNNELLIVEDDMLLRSQRKHMRHMAESERYRYLEILLDVQKETCMKNLKNREMAEGQQFRLGIAKCQEAFAKFETDQNDYLIKLQPNTKPIWSQISQKAQIVQIQHPQLSQKAQVSEQSRQKDDVQVRIRRFVSEMINDAEFHKKYFPNVDVKAIAAHVGSIKKRYPSKNKTFQGFLSFFKSETDALRQNPPASPPSPK